LVWLIVLYSQFSGLAAGLLIPYLAWVSFAMFLTISIELNEEHNYNEFLIRKMEDMKMFDNGLYNCDSNFLKDILEMGEQLIKTPFSEEMEPDIIKTLKDL